MKLIPTCFSFLDLIQLSFYFQKLLTEHDELTIFCYDTDYFLTQSLFVNVKGLTLKPYSEFKSVEGTAEKLNVQPYAQDYPKGKQALFLQHMGIGDMINMQGAVNYCSENIDEIYVTSHDIYKHVAKELYATNPKVRILITKTPDDICYSGRTSPGHEIQWTPKFRILNDYFEIKHISGLFTPNCIIWKNDWVNYPLPKCFYVDLGIDPNIKFTHNTIRSNEKSKALYKHIEGRDYIFVHQISSNTKLDLVKWDIHQRLTIDPDENLYKPGDAFYEVAQHFVKQGIFSYIDTIQHASELYTIDSSYCCLGLYIRPLAATKKACYIRGNREEMVGWFDQT
jgi:hypothetical protein